MAMRISMKRVLAITRKNLQALAHDKRSVGLLIFMPILLMVLFGLAFGQPVKHVPIKIVNLDEGGTGIPMMVNDTQFSDLFINVLKADDRVSVSILNSISFDLASERAKVYGGNNYYALLVIPADFSEEMLNFSTHIQLSIYVDGSDPQTISSVFAAVTEAIGEVLNEISGAEDPHLELNTIYVAGSSDLRPIDSLGPGILSFAIFLFMILTVTGGFTKERLTGTLFRVKTTSTSKSEFVLGYLLGNSLIALVQSVLLLVISVLFFQIHIVGNILLLFFILFVYAMSCVGLGIFASTFAKNELQAFQFIPLLLIPSMFFSGFIFPINSFPEVFQVISYFIPMTYSINISRAIMINGFGMDMFYMDFLILLLLTGAFLVLAVVFFKMKKK
ncbi:MAG: ABC transporter permease [Candidatus Lokiarchaeota archaeon]|nr:ABC transporter permease [Candidatus Lokiarchaeota archaeon]